MREWIKSLRNKVARRSSVYAELQAELTKARVDLTDAGNKVVQLECTHDRLSDEIRKLQSDLDERFAQWHKMLSANNE